MSLRVRPVDFEADREQLLRLLARNLQDLPHAARFSWLYGENPAGRVHTWFLCDESDRAVGVASLFPRAVWLDGKLAVCGQVGDFGVDLGFRSLGPALMLQRATFEPVVRGELAFCYDCPPHEKGMAMFHRLGLRENCRMFSHVKLLRTDRLLGHILGQGAARLAAQAVNPMLRWPALAGKNSHGLDCAVHEGDFGAEFSALDEAVGGGGGIRNRRSAEDLNWRYRRNPLRQFEVVTAHRRGKLAAYAVFSMMDDDAFLFDLFGEDLEHTGPALLQWLSELLRPRPIQSVRALIAGGASFASVFEKAGFVPRGAAARVVAFAGGDGVAQSPLQPNPTWNFQFGDVMA